MPNEPKADWEKEARELLDAHYHDFHGATLMQQERAATVIADALRSAHASGAREAEEKRHTGSEPPDTDRFVLAFVDGEWEIVFHRSDMWWDRDGSTFQAPDFWLDLPDASRVGGKETK